MLRAFGAVEREIRAIHVCSGVVMAVLSFVLSLGMGSLANYLLYRLCNTVLPSLGIGSGIRYEYHLSVGALLLSALIAILCGFLSSVLPYYVDGSEARREEERQNAAPKTKRSRKGKKYVV